MITKICNKCKTEKPTSEYYKHDSTKDFLHPTCKVCSKARSQAWAEKNKEKRREISRNYVKRNPQKRKESSAKYYQANKEKQNATRVQWVKDNPEKIREYGRRHANLRRARKLHNGAEPYTEKQMLETYGTNCYLCNEPVDLTAARRVGAEGWERGLHIEHVIPLSKGGPDTLENVRPAHGLCNMLKSDSV